MYYPKSYANLEFKRLLSEKDEKLMGDSDDDSDDDSDSVFESSIKSTTTTERKTCSVCLCTYCDDRCLRCEQNDAFEASLQANRQKQSVPNTTFDPNHEVVSNGISDQSDEESVPQSAEDLRTIRLRRFVQKPVRFRQSVGEMEASTSYCYPNGSQAGSKNEDVSQAEIEEAFIYGDDEVNRFLENEDNIEQQSTLPPTVDVPPSKNDIEELITAALSTYKYFYSDRTSKTVIVQRASQIFWSILLTQKFNRNKILE